MWNEVQSPGLVVFMIMRRGGGVVVSKVVEDRLSNVSFSRVK